MSQITPPYGSGGSDEQELVHDDEAAERALPERPRRERRPVALIVALVVALVVIAALVAVLAWPDNDEDDTTTPPPATEAPTAAPTTAATTAPTSTPTTAAPAPVDTSTAVFPHGDTRFGDAVEAARAFAVDFLGFTDPVVGELMQGDARSGEVELRPTANGPTTTVFVRQLGPDDSWWVLGSATADIAVDSPAANDAITSPLTLSGSALAFEGHVNVEVRQDGSSLPIGTGFVTGGGDVIRPFSGQVEFSAPTADYGAVVFLTRSGEDGRVWQAATVRVRFG